MRSKLFYLLLLIVCMFLFSISGRYTYAYFTDKKTVAFELKFAKLEVNADPLTINTQKINEVHSTPFLITNKTPLQSDLFIDSKQISNSWSDYYSVTLPTVLVSKENKTVFTGNISVKKIKELPDNLPQSIKLTVPVFIDKQLNIQITTLTVTINNQKDLSENFPSDQQFQGNPYYLQETFLYTEHHLLNTPTLFVKYTGPINDTSPTFLRQLFKNKMKIDNDCSLNIQDAQYIANKGFRLVLSEPETPLTFTIGHNYTFHFYETNISGDNDKISYFAIPNSVFAFTLASNLSLNNNNEIKNTTLLTRNQSIPYSFVQYNNSISPAKNAVLNVDHYSWEVEDTSQFSVDAFNASQVFIRQRTNQPDKETTLKLVRKADNTILFAQKIRSVLIDETIPSNFENNLAKEFLNGTRTGGNPLSNSGYHYSGKVDYSKITETTNGYFIPVYFKLEGFGLLSQHATFLVLEDDKNNANTAVSLYQDSKKVTLSYSNSSEYVKLILYVDKLKLTSSDDNSYLLNWPYSIDSSILKNNPILYYGNIQLDNAFFKKNSAKKSAIKNNPPSQESETATSQQTIQQTTSDSSSSEAKEPTVETSISDAMQ